MRPSTPRTPCQPGRHIDALTSPTPFGCDVDEVQLLFERPCKKRKFIKDDGPSHSSAQKNLYFEPQPLSSEPTTDALASSNISKSKQESGKFYLFPKLPLELRELIWGFAMPKEQVITISLGADLFGEVFKPEGFAIKTSRPAPVHSAVCKESRLYLAQVQKHCFAFTAQLGDGKGVWIDWKNDALYFTTENALLAFLKFENEPSSHINTMRTNLRYLAMGPNSLSYDKTESDVAEMENLELVLYHNVVGYDLDPPSKQILSFTGIVNRRLKRAREHRDAKYGIVTKKPHIVCLPGSLLKRVATDGFPKDFEADVQFEAK